MVLQITLGDLTAMDPGSIPNQDDFGGYESTKMVERFDELLAID